MNGMPDADARRSRASASPSTAAFAKVILFGEHAVVHGRTAVAAALNRGARARARRGEGDEVSRVELQPWGRISRVDDGEDEVARAYAALLDVLGAEGPVVARVDVEIPAGAGLGCSAAIGVALARAVAASCDRPLTYDTLTACAGAWERVFHGNPSGVDVAVSARGGVLAFKKGELPRAVALAAPIELAVACTGEPVSTRTMVEQVARQLARRPHVVERTFDGIDTLAHKGVAAIEGARWHEVGHLMDLNQALLASLTVSTEALERACNVAREAGALGAKLTGAGGGGCAIALAPGTSAAVLAAWAHRGIDGFAATIAAGTPSRDDAGLQMHDVGGSR